MFSFLKNVRIFPIIFLILLVLPSFSSYATPPPPPADFSFEGIFCNVYNVVKSIGKPLLLLIIVFIAGLAYFGKVQLIAVVMIVIGAVVFFGAPTIVNLVTGGSGKMCTEAAVDVTK